MGSSRSDTSSRSGIAYQPALDGVRALAVTLVLLFHHGVAWMTGGYVGVSVFFTLSGFLITSLLLAEHGATGRVSFARFYTRRVKRLLPASLACLTAVAVLGAAGAFQASSKLRREIVAAVLQVANWNDLLQGASYADLQGRRIAVAESTTTVQALDQGLACQQVKAEVVRTRTLAQAFDLLKTGQVDAIAGDRTALVGVYLLEGRIDGLAVFEELLSYEPYALALRRGDSDFRLLVDTALAEIYRTGEIDSIFKTWLAPLGPPSPVLVALYLLNALPE